MIKSSYAPGARVRSYVASQVPTSGVESAVAPKPQCRGDPLEVAVLETQPQRLTNKEQQARNASTMSAEDLMMPLRIVSTQLHAMNYQELLHLAVMECTVAKTFGRGSPNDRRLGSSEDDALCGTCAKTNMDCPGHLGYIDLKRWFLNPLFAKQAIWVLQSVCNSCGQLIIDEDTAHRLNLLSLRDTARLQAFAEHSAKSIRCNRHVGPDGVEIRTRCPRNPTYKPSSMKDSYVVTYYYEDKTKEKGKNKIPNERTIEQIDNIFKSIPPGDLRILGLEDGTNPRDWILKALPVIPPCARHHVLIESEIKHDFLTTSYVDIICHNNALGVAYDALREGITEGRETTYRERVRDLYFYIYHFMNNTDGTYTRASEETIQSIQERLTSKSGIIRGLSMGKRNDFTIRTVLGPNSKLKFGEIGFPERCRRTLTKQITVTYRNIDRIRRLYKEGRVSYLYPGTGKLKGCRVQVNDTTRSKYNVHIGDMIDRWGEDGDEYLCNRQPTLDKQSMMAYRIKFFPTETIGIFSYYTTPHNADFDGDEGNGHGLQTLGARTEARYLANVESCIMSPHTNRPRMGVVYNGISSAYMLTQDGVIFDDDDWAEAIRVLTEGTRANLITLGDRCRSVGVNPRSGRALFSVLLPPDFYYSLGEVRVRNGVLVSGVLTRKHIGPSLGSMIQTLWKMYTKARVTEFFTNTEYLLNWYLEFEGLTIGYRDCIVTDAAGKAEIQKIINEAMVEAQLKIDSLGMETSGMSLIEKDYREKQVRSFLDNVTLIGSQIGLKALAKDNPLNIMSQSGAKGSSVNTASIVGTLGQQFIKGQRPKPSLTGGTRCLPYFEPHSKLIEAHGYIRESFMTGLTPPGLIFHMMSSWLGIIDTAVKTADTGHMHHKINKVLEDVKICYDGSVRNANGVIFTYSFGGDGFAPEHMQLTRSSATGDVVSFIDLKTVVGKLNMELGYDLV